MADSFLNTVFSMIFIQNGTIYAPDAVIENGTLVVANGRIQTIAPTREIAPPPDAQVIDAAGMSVVPGFIDLQLNGGFGHDFTAAPETIWVVAEHLPQFGVTSFLPTIITSPQETVAAAQAVIAQGPPAAFGGAVPLGLHLEGPFLNPLKKGAHEVQWMKRPFLPLIDNWTPDNGVRLVTLAPELPNALDMIRTLAARGVVVSAGHSTAAFGEALAGFDAGVRYGTHLFNAMPALHHREPGLAGALLADDRVTFGIIPDGIHVHPALIRTVWQAAGQRMTLVTDAMAAMGMPPGDYQLGDFKVTVTETDSRLPDGTLAGSIVTMDAALRNLMAFTGCSLAAALPAVTRIPAALLGLPHKGRLVPGADADLALLSPDLQVEMVVVNGRIAYRGAPHLTGQIK
ncbi:MAG: N-acetylglucosamine-6-phosphate deacetylase [Anaerolineales bacterium]|nr:N-acetylglucosamine-6-phosphate deacetylase [Anaerolineales bacterium]